MILRADSLDAQHALPQLRKRPLGGSGRRHELGGRGALGRRQRLAIDLSVLGERQRFEREEMRGNHVRRQHVAKFLDIHIADHVGHELASPRTIFARNHRRLGDRLVGREHRLDLPGLDAKAADLHLLIRAPQDR